MLSQVAFAQASAEEKEGNDYQGYDCRGQFLFGPCEAHQSL